VIDAIVSQPRFIATMRGRTMSSSKVSDGQLEEGAFEAGRVGAPVEFLACWYWVLKLKARYLSGDYADALDAAQRAKALLWASLGHIQLLDYFYYAALTVAALHEPSSGAELAEWDSLLNGRQEQFREWAESNPPTPDDKFALVLAETARLEGRVVDAMALYEQAIQSARTHGFRQNEGVAHELAARFYSTRGAETAAQAHLREARDCYVKWGAMKKVRHLERLHPHLRAIPTNASSNTKKGAPLGQHHIDGSPKTFDSRSDGDVDAALSLDGVRERIHPEDVSGFWDAVHRARDAKTGYEFDYRVVLPDGSIRNIHTVAHPVLDSFGNLIEHTGTTSDVTERRQSEEALRRALADLAHAGRVITMGELTASIAHEVNQPIAAAVTSANACLRWLAGDKPNLEKARAAATRIVNEGARAGEIISRTRLFFEKGATPRELVDLNDIIRETIGLLRGEAGRFSVSVRTALRAESPRVMGDRVQLQQVIVNLVMNSLDAMKDRESVVRQLSVDTRLTDDEHVVVRVRDTGVGLPPQQADHIFNAFFTTKPHGAGMGLSISRSIIEAHGGRLWAEPNKPYGAVFMFSLPVETKSRGGLGG
jgi:signal transduction histidine kinase